MFLIKVTKNMQNLKESQKKLKSMTYREVISWLYKCHKHRKSSHFSHSLFHFSCHTIVETYKLNTCYNFCMLNMNVNMKSSSAEWIKKTNRSHVEIHFEGELCMKFQCRSFIPSKF